MSAFLTSGLILLLAVYPLRGTSAGNEAARAIELTDSARAFDFQLSQLKAKYTVVSDAYHFFKRRLDSHDVVDQGDFSWLFAQQGHFDEAFSQTVHRYMTAIQRNPPDIVIVGQISASPIRDLVQHGYSCILCGVAFHAHLPEGSVFTHATICRSTSSVLSFHFQDGSASGQVKRVQQIS